MSAVAVVEFGHKSSPRELLESGLAEMGLALSQAVRDNLLGYVSLLEKWNKVYNLTAVRDPARMIGLHILDSISVLSQIEGHKRILDVGTGGGLPGIPLAIVLGTTAPDARVTLLDTITKKTTFVRQVIGELRLTNASVITQRVESYRPRQTFDVVISRAFAELKDFVEGAGHLCTDEGKMLAMKGVHPLDEIARVSSAFVVEEVIPLQVPQVDGQRHLVVIKKKQEKT
ncbi:MAG: 16S rRNA (guanine(527)-N(7))-methyltransferase RsmG [Burkholderiales bacterium]|nr:16S rRNA (guanine(527)-N(7))-methyltransferase RsmG [Burkholderiales bacterium]